MDADSKALRWVRLESLGLRSHIELKSLSPSEDWERDSKSWAASQLDATYPDIDKHPSWTVIVLHEPGDDLLGVAVYLEPPSCRWYEWEDSGHIPVLPDGWERNGQATVAQ